jgi:uncharacterized protein (TIRG00374 family)
MLVGLLLLVLTVRQIDLKETVANVRDLGPALPLILLPGAMWHLLRTWGWSLAFPDDARPAFTRLFRVRLAADAVSFFTIRGIVGEPLKVVLLYDRVPPEVTTAAIALERLAFAIGGIVMAGLISMFAVNRLALSQAWDAVFRLLAIVAVLVVGLVIEVARHRKGDYISGPASFVSRLTGRRLESSRIIRFIVDVQRELLELLRGDTRRLVLLMVLPIVCYLLMAVEVWLVFWAIGRAIGVTESLTVETFARLGSVASWAIPASVGALEASNALVVNALGLTGAGALALTRRVRSLLWAAIGFAVYPRLTGGRESFQRPQSS